MNQLINIFNKRKHPSIYSDEIVPTKDEITKIVNEAYPLVTSFRKAFGYKVHILGPNKERSNELFKICNGHKQSIDDTEYSKENAIQSDSMGMIHIRTAPWILIATPRVCQPNAFQSDETDGKTLWEFADYKWMNDNNRESGALEIAMFLKMIMGGALQRGYDSGYCVCFPKTTEGFYSFKKHIPNLEFIPTVIQTIGKATKYQYEHVDPEKWKLNTAPNLDEIIDWNE